MKMGIHPGRHAFTLLEVILSMVIIALLSASVYAIVSSSIGASRTAIEQQLATRRLDSFLRVMRDTFMNLPAQGTVSFETGRAQGDEPEPRLLLGNVQGIFGMQSLAGGTAVLAARPRSDGTRTITLLRIPPHSTEQQLKEVFSSKGIPLLPKIRRPRWSFFQAGVWREEWPPGSPRPSLVRFEGELEGLSRPLDAVFYLPALTAPIQPQNTEVSGPQSSPPSQ